MEKEKSDALVKKYPRLLKGLRQGRVECGDGWYDIVERTLARLDNVKTKVDPGFVIIKEKFFELRIQGRFHDDLSQQIIAEAELESHAVCDKCGASKVKSATAGDVYLSSCGCARRRL